MTGLPVLFNTLTVAATRRDLAVEPLPPRVDVVVVGAGVIGLSIGWRLARRGLSVAVVDAGPAGGGTSAAATGMLAASAEHEPGGGPLLELARESLALWPALRRDVEADSGLSIDYRDEGTLIVAVGRDEVERLRFRHKMQRDAGLEARWLSGSAVLALESGLRPNIAGGILCPGDHQVDPRSTLQALRAAFLGQGGRLFEATQVERFEMEGGRTTGIVTSAGICRAGTVVVASGAAIATGGLLPSGDPCAGQTLERPVHGSAQPAGLRPHRSAAGRSCDLDVGDPYSAQGGRPNDRRCHHGRGRFRRQRDGGRPLRAARGGPACLAGR